MCEAVEAVQNSSSGQGANDAESFLSRLLSFEFFVSAAICRHILGYTRPLTVALQAKDCDLYAAHRMAQRLVKALESERTSEKFHSLWVVSRARPHPPQAKGEGLVKSLHTSRAPGMR